MKKRTKKFIVLFVIFVIVFSIWIHFLGLAASGFIGSVDILKKYIESSKSFPENLLELENFHGHKINNLKLNDIPFDEIETHNDTLYIDNDRVWIVKPKGSTKLWLNIFCPYFKRKMSFEVYKKYKHATESNVKN